jgi:hypothetical protein
MFPPGAIWPLGVNESDISWPALKCHPIDFSLRSISPCTERHTHIYVLNHFSTEQRKTSFLEASNGLQKSGLSGTAVNPAQCKYLGGGGGGGGVGGWGVLRQLPGGIVPVWAPVSSSPSTVIRAAVYRWRMNESPTKNTVAPSSRRQISLGRNVKGWQLSSVVRHVAYSACSWVRRSKQSEHLPAK